MLQAHLWLSFLGLLFLLRNLMMMLAMEIRLMGQGKWGEGESQRMQICV
jgi:hypothetical protein